MEITMRLTVTMRWWGKVLLSAIRFCPAAFFWLDRPRLIRLIARHAYRYSVGDRL